MVVVGAGLTGLWTAYYLLEADPALDVLLVEAQAVGYGASGRNGGWVSALLPLSGDELARRHGHEAADAMRAAMRDTVVEVGGVAAAEQIDCGFAFGGTVTLARNAPQLERVARRGRHRRPLGRRVAPARPRGGRGARSRRRGASAGPTRRTAPASSPPCWSAGCSTSCSRVGPGWPRGRERCGCRRARSSRTTAPSGRAGSCVRPRHGAPGCRDHAVRSPRCTRT